MDIGTASPTPEERAAVPHHLIDLVDPADDFTVSQFQQAYRLALADIRDRGATPVLVGGTGLYLRAVIDDLEIPGQYPDVRVTLDSEPDTGILHRQLLELDPLAAGRMESTNRRRIIRALEVTLGGGRPFSSYGPGLDHYPPTAICAGGAQMGPRLAQRAHRRSISGSDRQRIPRRGSPPLSRQKISRSAAQALGYRELLQHVRGECTLDEALEEAISRTRKFARRQERWFRRDPRIRWVDAPVTASDAVAVWSNLTP